VGKKADDEFSGYLSSFTSSAVVISVGLIQIRDLEVVSLTLCCQVLTFVHPSASVSKQYNSVMFSGWEGNCRPGQSDGSMRNPVLTAKYLPVSFSVITTHVLDKIRHVSHCCYI